MRRIFIFGFLVLLLAVQVAAQCYIIDAPTAVSFVRPHSVRVTCLYGVGLTFRIVPVLRLDRLAGRRQALQPLKTLSSNLLFILRC
jgi:hypothetical protein